LIRLLIRHWAMRATIVEAASAPPHDAAGQL
jgi:hypothetical protein